MVFYNNRKKTGVTTFIGGCAIFIGISAIITVFVLSGASLFSDYPFVSVFLLFMTGVFIYPLFRKKGKVYKDNIQVKNEILVINGIKIPISKINVDTYQIDSNFFKYHIWDTTNIFSLYSIFEDDLYKHLIKMSVKQNTFDVLKSKSYSEKINVITPKRTLGYNLETGAYKITEETTIIKQAIPSLFCFDGKFTSTT